MVFFPEDIVVSYNLDWKRVHDNRMCRYKEKLAVVK